MSFTPIRAYDNYITANLELSMLLEAGINCYIKDEYTITIDPLLSPALGGMKLMVEDESVPAAMYLLAKSNRLFLETVPCPRCRLARLELVEKVINYDTWIDRFKSLLLTGQEIKVERYYHCTACNSVYPELPATGE